MREADRRQRDREFIRRSLAPGMYGITDPKVLYAEMPEDDNPLWRMYKGYYRIFRARAFEMRLCGCCGRCRNYVKHNDYQGRCKLSWAGVRVGDWCGSCDFIPPEPGTYPDPFDDVVVWHWPSGTWENLVGSKKCISCRTCAYSVTLKNAALCRYNPPRQGLYGPEWPILERTGNPCRYALYARPVNWPFY